MQHGLMSLLPLGLYFWIEKWTFQLFFFLMKFIFLRLQTTWKSLVGGTGDKSAYISAGSWVEFTVFWLVAQLLFTEHLWCARHTNVFYNSHQCHLVFIFQMNKLVLRVTCPSSFINEQTEIPILLCLSLKPYRTGLNWKQRWRLDIRLLIPPPPSTLPTPLSPTPTPSTSRQGQAPICSFTHPSNSDYSQFYNTRKATPHPNTQLNKEKPNLH